MSDHDHGPLRAYEVTWLGRPPEVVQGHSVLFDSGGFSFMSQPSATPRFRIYGQFGTHWRMVLMGLEEHVSCIRDITEQVAALEAMAASDQEGEATS